MEVAVIAPIKFLWPLARLSGYHMVLAHIYVRSPKYREFYKERRRQGDFILLDNSAYEMTVGVEYRLLSKIAEDLRPTAVILPDARFDKDKTISLAEEARESFEFLGCKLVGVPQGRDMNSVLECYDWMHSQPWIQGFGIYEEIGQVCGLGNRCDFLEYLENTERVDHNRYYHLLGMEEDIELLRKNALFKWVSGVDSVKPIVYGMHGIDLSLQEGTEYPHRPSGYFDIEDLVGVEGLCKDNIQYCQRISIATP